MTTFKPANDLPARTPIAERMKFPRDPVTAKAQVTWPEPLLGMTCKECAFWDTKEIAESSVARGLGRCRRLAMLRGGNWGLQFHGKSVACSDLTIEEASDG